ncbi:MAG: adenosine deaminase [Candidatus Levybacteria bacterium]|nr:adenosine deaminase [Candidatus Levybacteria bacterium]
MDTAFPSFPLAELHAHLSTSIKPSVYWKIAQAQGFKLPKRNYKEFIEYITLSPEKRMNLNDYFEQIYHPLLDKLSSGTYAVEKATYEIMTGAYRNNIKLIELRNNPMKHNQGGELDLDHIIMAMLRGMERALLEHEDLSAGLIFCLAREFDFGMNHVIVEKAIKYKRRGVVGIDIAGPGNSDFRIDEYKGLVQKAKGEGLKITIHTGEADDADDMWEVVEKLQPDRIGHGLRAVKDKRLMEQLIKQNIVLEICPLSNIVTNAVKDLSEMKTILRTFIDNGVKFTINTDWPEVIEDAHLWRQYQLLLKGKILSEDELKKCNEIAFQSSFIPEGGLNAYL